MHVRVNKLQTIGGKKHQGDMKTFNIQQRNVFILCLHKCMMILKWFLIL